MKENSLRLFIFSSLSICSFTNAVCIAADSNQLVTIGYVDKRITDVSNCSSKVDNTSLTKVDKQIKVLEEQASEKVDETVFLEFKDKLQKNLETQLAKKVDKVEVDQFISPDQAMINKLEKKLKVLEQEINNKVDKTKFSEYKSAAQKKIEQQVNNKADFVDLVQQINKKADISYVDDKWNNSW